MRTLKQHKGGKEGNIKKVNKHILHLCFWFWILVAGAYMPIYLYLPIAPWLSFPFHTLTFFNESQKNAHTKSTTTMKKISVEK